MDITDNTYDEKLDYLTAEIMAFHRFMVELGEHFSNEKSEINFLLLSEKMLYYYERYNKKYNKTQLVYQFLKHTYKDDKDILNLYGTFQKVQKENMKLN